MAYFLIYALCYAHNAAINGKISTHSLLQAFAKKASSIRYYHTTSTLNKLKTNISDLYKQKTPNSIANPVGIPSGILTDSLRNSAIKEILKYRKFRFDTPLIKFTDKKIITCTDISDKLKRLAFIKELGSRSGIYLIQYKENPLIYYIGRSLLLKNRLTSHRRPSHAFLKDKFHVFANLVGWDKFTVSIVEFCEYDQQEIREKFYLDKYLPCLNTIFQSLAPRGRQATKGSKIKAKSFNRSLYKLFLSERQRLYIKPPPEKARGFNLGV